MDQDELTSALSQKTDDGLLVSLSKNFSDLDSDKAAAEQRGNGRDGPFTTAAERSGASTELADALISAVDTDGDGAISSDELSNGLTSAGSTADSAEIFSALDKNEDGTVSQDELVASLTPPHRHLTGVQRRAVQPARYRQRRQCHSHRAEQRPGQRQHLVDQHRHQRRIAQGAG